MESTELRTCGMATGAVRATTRKVVNCFASYHVGVVAFTPAWHLASALLLSEDAEVHVDAMLRVAAVLHEDTDANPTNDKQGLVDILHLEFPIMLGKHVRLVTTVTRIAGGIAIQGQVLSSRNGSSCARRHEVHAG